MTIKSFELNCLTKVEGHAKLEIEMDGSSIKKAKIDVFEPSRYFEYIVKGKPYDMVPSISQRICGICSVVHTITSIKAVEAATGVKPSVQTEDLRRLLLCASTIHSHTAHLFFFTAPDYLGVEDSMEMARKHRKKMRLGIDMQRTASGIVKEIGGRAIHPVNPRVGYFSSVPDSRLVDEFTLLKKMSVKAAELFLGFDYPDFENRTEYLALRGKEPHGLYEGDVAAFGGRGFRLKDYMKHLSEEAKYSSTAKYARYDGKPYMTGAIARMNISSGGVSRDAKRLLKRHKVRVPSYSPFLNNAMQAVESVHFCDRAIELLNNYSSGMRQEKKSIKPRAGEGIAACEAPRGTLYHHYRFSASGKCTYANIMTPTAQNVMNMEYDMQKLVPEIIKRPDNEIKHMLEMLIRAYDPCFSCSTHFLQMKLKR